MNKLPGFIALHKDIQQFTTLTPNAIPAANWAFVLFYLFDSLNYLFFVRIPINKGKNMILPPKDWLMEQVIFYAKSHN